MKSDLLAKVFPLFVLCACYIRHDILSHFFDGLNCGSNVRKPVNNNLPNTKNTKGVILKQRGTRMAKNGED